MARSTIRSLDRRQPKKKPKLRILVVSEGEKTEGLYLSLFIRDLRAANVQIDILGRECGSDPLTVVEFARDRFAEDNGYDICFCIIDRDNHPEDRFNRAKEISETTKNKSKRREFRTIVSDPCIEFWFLLHFTYTRSPFSKKGDKSRADCVIDSLKSYVPSYKKTCKDTLDRLLSRTNTAIDNSIRALADAEATGEYNPSTYMHELISRILQESSTDNRRK